MGLGFGRLHYWFCERQQLFQNWHSDNRILFKKYNPSWFSLSLFWSCSAINCQHLSWIYSPISMFSIWPHLGRFALFRFWSDLLMVGPFCLMCLQGFYGLVVRLKIIIGTYLCRLSTFIWDVQPFFVFNWATYGAFFAHFEPFIALFLFFKG